ncbi:hypothetical protein R1sor_010027 [Riccia sorocarpa]|uniref:Uncharacterized protein n=1 Tax=Riccia sorocarpa TaxID=122646 RepID=A0ABD3I0V5_9MARC
MNGMSNPSIASYQVIIGNEIDCFCGYRPTPKYEARSSPQTDEDNKETATGTNSEDSQTQETENSGSEGP